MKALSLHQPYATLIALGAKRIETRNWQAPWWLVGERFAIHASKSRDSLDLRHEEPFAEYLYGEAPALPLGAIVGTAVLDRCTQITGQTAGALSGSHPHEFSFGYYYPGRWAWVLRDAKMLAEPKTFRGAQGVFDVPVELVSAGLPYARGQAL